MRWGRAILVAWLLAACGGAGSDAPPPPGTAPPSTDEDPSGDGIAPNDGGTIRRPPPVTIGGSKGTTDAGAPMEVPSDSGDPCSIDADCSPGSTCFNGICVGQGQLRVSLSWDVLTDFDLHVLTPDGTEVYYGNPFAGGGILDVDDCVFSECRDPTGTHVENVFFVAPVSGTYTYWAHNYDEALTGRFSLEVAAAGRVVEMQAGTLTVAPPAESERYQYTF